MSLDSALKSNGFGSLHLQRVHQARPSYSPAPESSVADAMSSGSATRSGGTPQPSSTIQSLKVLNKSSGRLATFACRVSSGRVVHYQYRKRKDDPNSVVTAYKFEAYLVGTDAEDYCVGYVKGSLADCTRAKEKYTEGCACALSKVCFDTYTPTQ